MKTTVNTRINEPSATPGHPHSAGPRIHTSKPIEHRHERRKIREQLRRLNWIHAGDDEIFA